MAWAEFLKLKFNPTRVLALDFGGSVFKAAYLELRDNKYFLLATALIEKDLSHSTVEGLAIRLKEFLASNAITGKETFLSISDPEGIFIKRLTLPQMPNNDLINAVKWQLKEETPFDLETSVIDLQIIREFSDNEGAKKIELFCIFARREVVNKYLALALGCGLKVLRISSSEFNYCSTLNSLRANPAISAILDIGHTHSHIAIYQKNKLSFVRSLNFSTAKFSASLVGPLLTDKGKVEIEPLFAQSLMEKYGLAGDNETILEGQIRGNNIIPLVRPLLETLTREIKRSFDFFQTEAALASPEILYLTGGGANLKNLSNYLAAALKIKVVALPLPEGLDIAKIDRDQFPGSLNQLSSVLGLGLTKGGINLLPPEVRSQQVELIEETSLRVMGIISAVVLIFSLLMINFQITDYKKRLKIAGAHLQSVEEIKALKLVVDSRQDLINKIHQGLVPGGGILKLISAIIPPSIILEELDFDQAGHLLHLNGMVQDSKQSAEKILTDFMKDLEGSEFVLDANLQNSKEFQGISSFEIECLLAK